MFLLENKTAIITGASKGIGKAIAELFAAEGAGLILISRNLEKLQELKTSLKMRDGAEIHIYRADVTNYEELQAVFKDLQEKKIGADILVNNAGVMIDSTLQMVKPETIQTIYSTNVFGSMYCAQLAIKLFIRKRKGSIINMASIIGTRGNSGQTVYGSSKAAVVGFTQSLSKELASLNIRVNAIAPGFIDTDMTRGMNEKFYEKNLASIGMKRIGTPEDVAKTALYLASELSTYVTGQVIGVDGGMVI
jgi:3-oxoacyl-[acyl-carrier protein] reductase